MYIMRSTRKPRGTSIGRTTVGITRRSRSASSGPSRIKSHHKSRSRSRDRNSDNDLPPPASAVDRDTRIDSATLEPPAAAMTIDVTPAAQAAPAAAEVALKLDDTPDFYYIKTDNDLEDGYSERFNNIFEQAIRRLENPPTIIDFLIIPQFGMKLPGGRTFSSTSEKKGLLLNSITESIDEMYALYLTADNADKNASDDDYTLRGGVKNLKAVLTFQYDAEQHCIKIDYICVNHLFQYKGAGTKILEYFIGMIKKYVIYYNETHNTNFGISICLFSLNTAITFYIKNQFEFDNDYDKDYYGPINYEDIRSYYALINNANEDISKINKKKFNHVRKFTKKLKEGPLGVDMSKTVTSHNGRPHEGLLPTQSLEFGGGRKSRRKKSKTIKNKFVKRTNKLRQRRM